MLTCSATVAPPCERGKAVGLRQYLLLRRISEYALLAPDPRDGAEVCGCGVTFKAE
jgi:hypothetical protein